MAPEETFSGTVKAEVQITEPEPKQTAEPEPAAEQAQTPEHGNTVTPDDEPGIVDVAPEMPPIGDQVTSQGIPINPVDGNPIAPGYADPPVDVDGEPVRYGHSQLREKDPEPEEVEEEDKEPWSLEASVQETSRDYAANHPSDAEVEAYAAGVPVSSPDA